MALLRRKRKEGEAGFRAEVEARPDRRQLTPVDVQQKVFRLSFRGYNEHDVDQFLDEITEELASLHEENKRLREETESRGDSGSEEAKRRAEETVRRAREHAAKLIEDAERQTGGGGGPSTAYLVREREFLQQLAALVQERATTLKDEARRARSGQDNS